MFAEQAYLFRHAVLRQAAYQLQLPSTRAALHRLALEILEGLPGIDANAVALELAEHARLGAEPALKRAKLAALREAELKHTLVGARYSAAMFDTLQSISAYQRALELMSDADERAAETHSVLADQFARHGLGALAMQSFARSLELAPETETGGRGHVHLAWFARARSDRDEVLRRIRACEKLAERINSERLRISVLILRSIFALDDQRLDEGLALQREAAARAEQAGDDAQSQTAHANLIVCLLVRGQFAEAEAGAIRAEALAIKAGNLDIQAFVLIKRGLTYCQRREYVTACEFMARGAELARRVGSRRRLLEALGDLTLAQIGAGRFDECELRVAEGANLARDMAAERDAQSFGVKTALLHRGRGQYVQAVSAWRAIEAAAPDEFARVEAGVEVALSLALSGRFEEAERQVAELGRFESSTSEFLAGGLNVARGLCEAARGNKALASEAFKFALKQLNAPVDDCMHDAMLAHAGLAQALDGSAAREAAFAGLAEAKRRGIGENFPCPHLQQALATLGRAGS